MNLQHTTINKRSIRGAPLFVVVVCSVLSWSPVFADELADGAEDLEADPFA